MGTASRTPKASDQTVQSRDKAYTSAIDELAMSDSKDQMTCYARRHLICKAGMQRRAWLKGALDML